MRILGISGSLRRGSHNLSLLRAAAAQLPPDAGFEEYRELAAIPAYDEDLDVPAAPQPVRSLRRAIGTADAVIIATPEYNSSFPGALKNALDWASRPWPENCLRGTPVCVIGASAGLFGAVWAQAELRKVLSTIGANVIDQDFPVGQADQAFDEQGRLKDPQLRGRLAEILTMLTEQASLSPRSRCRPSRDSECAHDQRTQTFGSGRLRDRGGPAAFATEWGAPAGPVLDERNETSRPCGPVSGGCRR